MKSLDTSIIISTYNNTTWLEKVLYGYNNQTYMMFEVVIADDGSGQETKDLLARMQKEVFYPIIHVWHEDNGFQKSQILNKAVLQCNTPYTIMSDGDCIPRKDFVEQHVKFREQGFFLSGGYFMLPMDISEKITKDDIYAENCFDLKWLKDNGLYTSFKNNKLTAKPVTASILNLITPTNASWNGHNASGWTQDIIDVNGLNEEMQYGGQDRELGERLFNAGIHSKQIRYNAVVVHLDHPRGYKNEVSIKKNQAIRRETRELQKKWTAQGILKDVYVKPSISIILSVHAQTKYLEKSLWGFEQQDIKDFELIITEFGVSHAIKGLIHKFQNSSLLRIRHICNTTNINTAEILNKAIAASEGEYLIFTSGDCLPRKDFVYKHIKYRSAGYFLSGSYLKLTQQISDTLMQIDVETQACFNATWLLENGQPKNFDLNKLSSKGSKEVMLNALTVANPSWDSKNASAWRKDIFKVNGFDSTLQNGTEGKEFGERLTNYGVQGLQIRYSAVTMRLAHASVSVTEDAKEKNKPLITHTRKVNVIWTPHGIVAAENLAAAKEILTREHKTENF